MIKRHLSIALVAVMVLFFACQKETKTVTKVDPKTGKTITVEVPVEDKETAKVENPAIKDSLGVYHATFKLEKGKTYPFSTYQRDVQTLSDGKQNKLPKVKMQILPQQPLYPIASFWPFVPVALE